ncbi:MAG: SPFH domain-containing protein [Candidatus Woesearchaeota archaeon]|jgi:regulator of protease activity HflC (stomatin/prohibitin superfamily)
MINLIMYGVPILLFIVFLAGIRIVRPTERGLVETLGKYSTFIEGGFCWVFPIVQRMIKVEVTEKMVDAEPQEIITKDKLNAVVDAQVYFKVKLEEKSVKASQYNVYNCEKQIVQLARTTLRNIIGTMTLNDANSNRDEINKQLMITLIKETQNWGIEVVRAELKEINPPKDVQETMNKVVKAENEKQAAVDFATATETQADGKRRASIKEAEGEKQAAILKAEGQSQAFDLINKSFTGNAQLLKELEVTQKSLENNSKIIITKDGINPQLIIGEIPLKK